MNKNRKTYLLAALASLAFAACSGPSVPESYDKTGKKPTIFPDYTDVTVPCNIAPLNFKVLEKSDRCVAQFTMPDGQQFTFGDGKNIKMGEDEWKEMLQAARGKDMNVEVFACKDNGTWTAYKPFTIHVATDSIDPYISYRLVNPSYVAYEGLSICQRRLDSFDETEIYDNRLISENGDGQCINCHSYQNYSTRNMQFHMRQKMGGTMIVHNGTPHKVDLKTDSTLSAGVYPAWHPSLPLIAYSTDNTGQSFHTKHRDKIEVQDTQSDLILYDVEKNEVQNISNRQDQFECFPWWSPDGKTLYYCSAYFDFSQDTCGTEEMVIKHYKDIKYNIYRRDFHADTHTFGPEQLVYDARKRGKSATFPRISPDGRYLLFAQGAYGCFHVWHNDADLYVVDLKTSQTRSLARANSRRAESYHSWSSNGRWIMFISRRDDGNYSRLYFSYFDRNGKEHKAFELPQKSPDFYDFFLCSYNVPEFMKEPVHIEARTFASVAKREAKKATFKSR